MSFKISLRPSEIGKFINGIHLFRGIKEMLQGENHLLLDAATKGVILLDNLREQAISPTAEMLIKAIPGDWDAKLRDALVNIIIPKIISEEAALLPCLQKPTVEEQAVCLFDMVATKPDDTERAKFWHGLASSFTHEIILFIEGQPIDINDIFAAVASIAKRLFGHKSETVEGV